MSNITGGEAGSFSSGNTGGEEVQQKDEQLNHYDPNNGSTTQQQQQAPPAKKKRNLPGTPDPSAEVIALSPTTLMATNRFVCEICNKGFQRDQNLQLHRRGHNLPWKLKQRTTTEIRKRVYVCPESSCVHHNPTRALGDLTGIKKHFCRKHGEKKWKCDKCSKKYAVQSDWKAHSKTCGTREYKCDCGTIFSRRDSFITHRAFCDALSEENNKAKQGLLSNMGQNLPGQVHPQLMSSIPINNNNNSNTTSGTSGFNQSDTKVPISLPQEIMSFPPNKPLNMAGSLFSGPRSISSSSPSLQLNTNSSSSIFEGNGHQLASLAAHMPATALLQKAAQMGATVSNSGMNCQVMQNNSFVTSMAPPSFSAIQPQNDQSFINQFIQKGQHGNSYENGMTDNLGMTNMGMLNSLLDQNSALLKNIKHDNSNSNSTVLHGGDSKAGLTSSTKDSNGSEDMMTLDFLGIGGGARHGNFYELQQQKQQEMGFEGIGQRIQGLSHFQQQASMEKPMWEV
nr:protein indeterminate-domain 2-like [Quercus suber]POE71680.1 protein indeterminate-domain 2 [Quercus suber]